MATIAAEVGLAALGWDDGWSTALAGLAEPDLVPARVSRVDRGMCTVMTGTDEMRVSMARGVQIAVGDWVAVAPGLPEGSGPRIAAVLPRRCMVRRAAGENGAATQVVAANVDTVLLCDALDGDLSLRHLERFLALAWQSGATPVVLITKSDTLAPAGVAGAVEAVKAVAAGVEVLLVSSTTGEGLAGLGPYLLGGRTVALLGLSGAGKSTLVNLLAGAEVLATGEVRKDGKGRHTTTHRELIVLPGGGLLIDTPGMRALSVIGAGDGVDRAFRYIEEIASRCRFGHCSHTGEEGCAIAAAVADGALDQARVDSWLRLKAEPATSAHESARQAVDERKRRKAAKVAIRRGESTSRPGSAVLAGEAPE